MVGRFSVRNGSYMNIGRGFLYWLNRLLGDVRLIHDNASNYADGTNLESGIVYEGRSERLNKKMFCWIGSHFVAEMKISKECGC